MTIGDGTTTPGNFASQLLAALGLPTSQAWQDVINTWVHAEGGYNPLQSGGAASKNPLNAGCGWGLQIGCSTLSNGAKVGVYPNLDAAVQSYAGQLQRNAYGYPAIFGATSPINLANAISASSWSSSHYSGYTATMPHSTTPGGRGTGPGYNTTVTGILALLIQRTNGFTTSPTGTQVSPGQYAVGTGTGANPVSDVVNTMGKGAGVAGNAVGGALGSFLGLVGGSFVNLIVLGFGIFLIVIGAWQLVKGAGGTDSGKAMKEIAGAVTALVAKQDNINAFTRANPATPTANDSPTTTKPSPVIQAPSTLAPSGQQYSPDTIRFKSIPKGRRYARPSKEY